MTAPAKARRIVAHATTRKTHRGRPSAAAGRRRHQRQAQTVRVCGRTVKIADLQWRYDA